MGHCNVAILSLIQNKIKCREIFALHDHYLHKVDDEDTLVKIPFHRILESILFQVLDKALKIIGKKDKTFSGEVYFSWRDIQL